MPNVVLSASATSRGRQSLVRALARFPARVEAVPLPERVAQLKRAAAEDGVEWIVLVDDDAVLAADAFGSLRRSLGGTTAIVGGRALVGATQRLGAMFGPSRSGPNPFDLITLAGPQTDRNLTDLVRGPVDVPQRGVLVVAADFIRDLGDAPLDSAVLHLDLAVHARAAGRAVVCEPALSFTAGDDAPDVQRRLSDLRRFTAIGTWNDATLHRDPARMRSAYVTREARVMGNIRGYARRPYPPCDLLIVANEELALGRARRQAAALTGRGTVMTCKPDDGAAVRRALMRTGDRYLLVADASALPDRAGIEMLAERLERSGRVALAHDGSPQNVALIHLGRIVHGESIAGPSVADVVAALIAALPERRLFAAGPAGEIVPDALPPLRAMQTIDVVFVAASKPAVTQQSLQIVMGEPVNGSISVVYPAGSATTEKLFSTFAGLRLAPDDSDVQLAVGLNRALGACRSDVVAVIRDDVQISTGFLARLHDAFRRIARLGIAVPRVGGNDRPESLPDLSYRNSAEMQLLSDRRAEAFAREASLLDTATVPVMVVSREALEVVGGFDETFGFSRLGIEDFARRVRAANFLVARCDDAYAHLFDADSGSFIGNLDAAPFLRAAFDKRWSAPRGFDPATDRVSLREAEPAGDVPVSTGARLRVLLPLRDADEWQRAKPVLTELAAAFRVHDPLDVAIGLDGTFQVHAALGEIREVLLASGAPMEETVNVSIDFVGNIAEWRGTSPHTARVAGFDRDDLMTLPAIDGAAAARSLLAVPIG